MRASSRALWVTLGLGVLSGCTCAQLPEAVFQCEADGTCAQAGFVCGDDGVCRAPLDAGRDAGVVDAGVPDAGMDDAGVDDAGFDAGLDDAGFDAGLDDAGFDAGVDDAGFDAGVDDAGLDAGMDDAGFDAGVIDAGVFDAGCIPTGAIDEPDPSGLDVDCDGFDGDLTRAVFVDHVNGRDNAPGTRADPVKNLAHAATLAKEQIYLALGTYPGDVTLADAVAVYGGCDPANAWVRTTTKSVITGALVASPADAGRVVLERLEVQAPAATNAGAASVAVTLHNASSASRITHCRFVGGVGANGGDGTAAPAVNPGTLGGDGLSGDLGGDGGLGGAGANCDDAGTSAPGFSGGSSGDDGLGLAGLDVTQGGAGSEATYTDGGLFDGVDGGDALAGANGLPSSARPADPPTTALGTLVSAVWQGVSLGTWAPAQSGHPGGGGGAGGGLLDLLGALLARGGGAGGGGSGGCGGRSGTAGQSGGASIALVLFNSSPTLADVQLVTTQAGRGGNGGSASPGGPGGAAGAGQPGQTISIGTAGLGGRGASGGAGGAGRQGPGGWGGPVVGLFCGGASTPVTDASTTWTQGTPGAAGTGDPTGLTGGVPANSGYSANCP